MGERLRSRTAPLLQTAACALLGLALCAATPSPGPIAGKAIGRRFEPAVTSRAMARRFEPVRAARAARAASPPERSEPLRSGWHNPMPSGVLMGYPADTGLDIAGFRVPVYAMGAGRILYSESGHTLWAGPHDDDNAVLLELDTPVPHGDRSITHVWYAHLSELRFEHAYGLPGPRVAAGERLGTSGIANGCLHLHIGLLLNRHIRQRYEWLLRDDQIRSVLGYRRGQRLPRR
jgi:hypothetical protein